MIQVLLVGIVGAAAVTAVVAAHKRAPTRTRCPQCAAATQLVLLPPVLRRNEFVHLRWCPRCEWQGLGRKGPEWVPGRRLAHSSGFHWGDERFRSDFGFQFRRIAPPAEAPPHHPSGFRFLDAPTPEPTEADHPSGFRFVQPTASGAETAHHPSGFRFPEAPTPEPPDVADHPSGFRFAAGPAAGPEGADHPSGFRFAEGAQEARASAIPGRPAREPDELLGHPSGFRWGQRGAGEGFSFR